MAHEVASEYVQGDRPTLVWPNYLKLQNELGLLRRWKKELDDADAAEKNLGEDANTFTGISGAASNGSSAEPGGEEAGEHHEGAEVAKGPEDNPSADEAVQPYPYLTRDLDVAPSGGLNGEGEVAKQSSPNPAFNTPTFETTKTILKTTTSSVPDLHAPRRPRAVHFLEDL